MRRVTRVELSPPRTISAPAGARAAPYRPWVEISALARVAVPDWGLTDSLWIHWAVPMRDGSAEPDRAVAFDPGRRAATPGQPAPEARASSGELDQAGAEIVREALVARWSPLLHYHRGLRLASRMDEPIDGFRRRCLALLVPLVRRLDATGGGEGSSLLVGAIETRALGSGELEVVHWRLGVGWYPSGIEPAAAPEDPRMLQPQVRRS